MERTNYFLIILILAFSGLFQLKASDSEDILRAYQQGDMSQWKAVKRLIGEGSGIIFKGAGFYENDYKKKSYPKSTETSSSKK